MSDRWGEFLVYGVSNENGEVKYEQARIHSGRVQHRPGGNCSEKAVRFDWTRPYCFALGTVRLLRCRAILVLASFFPFRNFCCWVHSRSNALLAAYGLRSVFNVASEVGKTDSVLQAEFRTKDKQKARQILGYSFIGGLLVVLVAYLLM